MNGLFHFPLVFKDLHVNDPDATKTISQSEMTILEQLIIQYGVQYKRLFVTATTPAVYKAYNISQDNIFILAIPETYIGYEYIQYNVIDTNGIMIDNYLSLECERIRNTEYENPTGEAIHIVTDVHTTKHSLLLQKYSRLIPDAVINTYNSKKNGNLYNRCSITTSY